MDSPKRKPKQTAFALTPRRIEVLRAVAAAQVTRHENADPDRPHFVWHALVSPRHRTVTALFLELKKAGMVAVGAMVPGTRSIRFGPDRVTKLTTLGRSVLGDLDRVASFGDGFPGIAAHVQY